MKTVWNRLKKVSSLLELLVSKFSAAKVPGADIVVEESMVPFSRSFELSSVYERKISQIRY